jgi:cytoskeleton protein RodZ
MNENQGQAAVEGVGVGVGDSAGARLRRAREQSGLHIAALAVTLKVPVKRLEALEADRYDLLPGPVFTRALAASVCRSLKLDAAAVLALLGSKHCCG